MKRHRTVRIGPFVFCCLTLWLIGVPRAWGQSQHTARLIEGAKREGKLVWYTSMSIAESKPLLDIFEKKYPFVNGELFRASGEKTMNRIITETRAGRWGFDVVSLSEIGTLIERKLISPYRSPEAKAHTQEFRDPEGKWTGVYNNYYVIGYNTDQVSEAEAPKDWEDLLDPKWKSKISIDREEYPWYATLVAAWGKEKAQKYMKALAQQGIQWRKGHTLITQLMGAGEFPVAIVYAHRTESLKKKGAPIEWVNTLDPIVVSVNAIALSVKPNSPNTARLFIDFILSKEAQEKIRSFYRIPARSDVEPLSPKMDPAKLRLKVVPKDIGKRYNQYVREFRSIFGL
ncbi:MAG: ABC transporter substrate-binding protein [Candidatus Binatia bacterium]